MAQIITIDLANLTDARSKLAEAIHAYALEAAKYRPADKGKSYEFIAPLGAIHAHVGKLGIQANVTVFVKERDVVAKDKATSEPDPKVANRLKALESATE